MVSSLGQCLETTEPSTVRPSQTTRPSWCIDHLFKGIHSLPLLRHCALLHTCRVESMVRIKSISLQAHTWLIHYPLDIIIGKAKPWLINQRHTKLAQQDKARLANSVSSGTIGETIGWDTYPNQSRLPWSRSSLPLWPFGTLTGCPLPLQELILQTSTVHPMLTLMLPLSHSEVTPFLRQLSFLLAACLENHQSFPGNPFGSHHQAYSWRRYPVLHRQTNANILDSLSPRWIHNNQLRVSVGNWAVKMN